MNKYIKKILSCLLCVFLAVSAVFPVFAEDAETAEETTEQVLSIKTLDEFLSFAEQCRFDEYSKGLSVRLETDLDLTDTEFAGIPIFCGSFDGADHTISGLDLTQSGSIQGFFRYITDTASVKNLNLQGELSLQGSSSNVGILAGSNAGLIENCTVSGTLTGKDYIGGLVGINLVTGTIDHCEVLGRITGNHFVGGIAGKNDGVIRNSSNHCEINITAQQNNVEFSDISINTMTGSESANTVTDVGGIAGTNSGVIRTCENHGPIGYAHMGYNIGGIAGSQVGYISECINFGDISGRKEVGGIVGQMEPVTNIDFTQDTLQILQEQVADLSALASQASANAHSSTEAMNRQFSALNSQIEDAKGAIDSIKPDLPDIQPGEPLPPDFDPSFPDEDSLNAAKNQLSSSMNAMMGSLDGIVSSSQNAAQTLSGDMQALANQAGAIGNTINNASEHVGGTVTDVSDADTADNTIGKIYGCTNNGSILADLNAGGIAGAIGIENDLDHEDDWKTNGYQSLNFQSELRAVITDSKNTAPISIRKRNAGGIVGWQAVGLVKGCLNTGAVDAEKADYVGGISGSSSGFIRSSNAKCALSGASSVGGIAGSASIVTDCRSMVQITGADEKVGTILGISETPKQSVDAPIADNYYLCIDRDLGGIDGISYTGMAQPQSKEEILNFENVPDEFSHVIVKFIFEDNSTREISLPLGGDLEPSQIPSVPSKEGYTAEWEGLKDANQTNILFNMTFKPVYTPLNMTIQSSEVREDGRPILLAVGEFPESDGISLTALSSDAALPDGSTPLEGFNFQITPHNESIQLHYAPPADADIEHLKILVRGADGSWKDVPSKPDGHYLVFSVNAQDQAFCAIPAVSLPQWVVLAASAAIVLAFGGIVFVTVKKRKAKKAAAQ